MRRCCVIGCGKPATKEIWGTKPYDHTDACDDHVEALKPDGECTVEPIAAA